jgi:histidine triad (HIT) family protein
LQLPPDCLFAGTDGDHVRSQKVRALRHRRRPDALLSAWRHVATLRDVGQFEDEEVGRMLRFAAETAARVGLDDYRVIINVGPGGGQTVFHLHLHVLGGSDLPGFE